jgi:hypothetical protein
MSQNPLVASGNQAAKTSGLKPVLAAALSSLEVQLEQELARYRRTRLTLKPNSSLLGNSLAGQVQAFTDLNILGGKNQGVKETPSTSIPEIKTSPSPPPIPTPPPPPPIRAKALETPLPPPPPPPTLKVNQEVVKANKTNNVEEIKQDTKLGIPPEIQPYIKKQTSVTSGSIVPANSMATAPVQPNQESKTQEPEDYLESSEALLRSLAEEEPLPQKRPINARGLLSPLGIGSMLLLLVSSLTLGFFAFKGGFNTGGSNATKENNPVALENAQSEQSKAKTVAANPEPTPIPKSPNLATGEDFKQVNTAGDVAALKPKTSPKPIVNPISTPIAQAPAQPAQPVQSIAAAQPVQPVQSSTQPAVVTAGQPTPIATTAATPQPTPNPANLKPSADGFFHLVIDNNNETAYTSTKKVVRDAYLSLDKKLIFVGAARNPKEANQILEELKQQGISARLNQP